MRTSYFILSILSFSWLASGVASAATLDFNRALDKIVNESPSVGSAREHYESVKSKNIPSHLVYLPTLSVTGGATYGNTIPTLDTPATGSTGASGLGGSAGALTSSNSTTYSVMGTAQVNLFHFGADAAENRAANLEESSERLLVSDAVLKAEELGVSLLIAVVQAQNEVQIFTKTADIQNQLLTIAKARYRKGLLSAQETDKVSVDLDIANARLKDAEVKLASSVAAMQAQLGKDLTVSPEWPWKDKMSTSGPKLENSTDKDLSNRPDVQAAQKGTEAAGARVDQTWGKIFPSLDLSASYGYGWVTPQNWNGPQWYAGVALTIPLFDKLTNYSAYEAQTHTKSRQEFELEKIRRQARESWMAARDSFRLSLESALEREKTLTTSRSLYEDNLRRFGRGLVSANDLVVDQNRLSASELLAAQGWGATHLNFAQLCHSLGKRIQECIGNNQKSQENSQ